MESILEPFSDLDVQPCAQEHMKGKVFQNHLLDSYQLLEIHCMFHNNVSQGSSYPNLLIPLRLRIASSNIKSVHPSRPTLTLQRKHPTFFHE